MNITQQPFAIDFVGNNPKYRIKTSPNFVDGRCYRAAYDIESLTIGILEIGTPYGTYQWEIKNTANPKAEYEVNSAQTTTAVYAELENKIIYNAQLNENYEIEITKLSNKVRLFIKAKEGRDDDFVTIQSTGNESEISEWSHTTGITRTPKDNYNIEIQFITENEKSPKIYLDDEEGKVEFGTKILQDYFKKTKIPRPNESMAAISANDCMLKFRLLYAERTTITSLREISEERIYLKGKINEASRKNNRADWKDIGAKKLYQQTDINIYGQNSNETITTDEEKEEFLYISNFTNTAITKTITIEATGKEDSQSRTQQMTFPAKSITRIPVGVNTVNLPQCGELVEYRVKIPCYNSNITRIFKIKPREYTAQTMFLKNRLGLYESITMQDISEEKEIQGENVTVQEKETITINKTNKTYTLKTGKKTASEMRLLEAAVEQEQNLWIKGKHAEVIAIIPGTYTIRNESEDMVEAEMQFKIVETIDREPEIIEELTNESRIEERESIIQIR